MELAGGQPNHTSGRHATSVHVHVCAVCDKLSCVPPSVCAQVIYNNLKLYGIGQRDDLFSLRSINANWTSFALLHGLLVFFVPVLGAAMAHEMSIFEIGVYVFSAVVVVVDLRVVLLMGTLRYHCLTGFIVVASIVVYFLYELVVDGPMLAKTKPMSLYTGVAQKAFGWGDFWMGLLFVSAVSYLAVALLQCLPVLFEGWNDDYGDGLVQKTISLDAVKMKIVGDVVDQESRHTLTHASKHVVPTNSYYAPQSGEAGTERRLTFRETQRETGAGANVLV